MASKARLFQFNIRLLTRVEIRYFVRLPSIFAFLFHEDKAKTTQGRAVFSLSKNDQVGPSRLQHPTLDAYDGAEHLDGRAQLDAQSAYEIGLRQQQEGLTVDLFLDEPMD